MNTAFAQDVATSVLTSAITVAGAAWFLKRYTTKRIDSLFEARGKAFDARIKLATKYSEQVLDAVMVAVPHIHELMYRSRNTVLSLGKSVKLSQLDELEVLLLALSEHLYQSRAAIKAADDTDLFDRLHDYRALLRLVCQMLFAIRNRKSGTPGDAQSELVMDDENVANVKNAAVKLDTAFKEAETKIGRFMKETTKLRAP
jgi:hypothetical protein